MYSLTIPLSFHVLLVCSYFIFQASYFISSPAHICRNQWLNKGYWCILPPPPMPFRTGNLITKQRRLLTFDHCELFYVTGLICQSLFCFSCDHARWSDCSVVFSDLFFFSFSNVYRKTFSIYIGRVCILFMQDRMNVYIGTYYCLCLISFKLIP